jgi:hypothetical protein
VTTDDPGLSAFALRTFKELTLRSAEAAAYGVTGMQCAYRSQIILEL